MTGVLLRSSLLRVGVVSCLLFSAVQRSEAACVQPPQGIVAWWAGDNNALDTTGYHNNGTLTPSTGGVGYYNAKVGKGFKFTGGDSIVQGVYVQASSSLDVRTAITIEGWIKPSGTQGPIIEYRASNLYVPIGVSFWQFGGQHTPSTQLYAYLVTITGSNYVLYADNVLTNGVWQHVAVTFDQATGNGYLYVNGNCVATQWFGTISDLKTDDYLYIGYRPETPSDGWASFNGGIDELSIYNRALSAAEISSIYQAGTSGKCK